MVVRIFQRMANLNEYIHQLRKVIALAIIQNLSQGITMYQFHREIVVPLIISS